MKLMGKGVLFLAGFLLLFFEPISISTVGVFLTALISTCFMFYFDNTKITACIAVVYFLVAFFFPMACVFLPLLYFDVFRQKQWGLAAVGALTVINFFRYTETLLFVIVLILLLIAFILQFLCKSVEILQKKLIHTRDTNIELNLVLQEKNKYLVENQDYEVHLATLNERNRIAREIHDNVGHLLSRSILQIGAMMAANKSEQLSQQINELKDTLTMAMDSIRKSVHDLHDTTVDIQQIVKTIISDFSSYQIRFQYDMGEDVPISIRYCFIAVIKEAMVNVTKHSNADKVEIIVQEHPAFYQMHFRDNGTNPTSVDKHGLGLKSMRQRTQSLNGLFNVHTEEGFSIFISIPKKLEGKQKVI